MVTITDLVLGRQKVSLAVSGTSVNIPALLVEKLVDKVLPFGIALCKVLHVQGPLVSKYTTKSE